MEDEMSTYDIFPLLDLPAGVETILLPFVAPETGGLQSLLNLRQVCSTTKSWIDTLVCSTTKPWVDTLPPRQGKQLFSKAQVRMDSKVETLERFLESAPPFEGIALSLDIKDVLDKNPRAEEQELWNKFCDVWSPKLENLKLRNDYDGGADAFNGNRRILNLVESPNIQTLDLLEVVLPWNSSSVFPSSFYEVNDLAINFKSQDEDNGALKRFYSELTKNQNLRKLENVIHNVTALECVEKFIDAKKEDKRLEIKLHLAHLQWEDTVEDKHGVKCLKFAQSVVASKSTVRLELVNYYYLESMNRFLPRHVAMEMFEKVELVDLWKPEENTLSLLEGLPRLKEVMVDSEPLLNAFDVDLDQVTFPPRLEKLGFTHGCPAIRNLPVALKSLTLLDLSCNVAEFVSSLTLLKTHCAGLESLRITWKCDSLTAPAEEIQKSPGFTNLRSLIFDCFLDEKDVETFRAVLLRGFQVESLQLYHFSPRFWLKGRIDRRLPVLDAPFLTRLCEGPIGNSLLVCDMEEESATPDGLPLLGRLTLLAAANAKGREEREGRGQWQRQWEIVDRSDVE